MQVYKANKTSTNLLAQTSDNVKKHQLVNY
jgi:hypothetical protein